MTGPADDVLAANTALEAALASASFSDASIVISPTISGTEILLTVRVGSGTISLTSFTAATLITELTRIYGL